MDYLDKEEKNSIESYDRGEWKSVNKMESFTEAANQSLKKNKRINIRLTDKDYQDIQLKAMEEGIPYQTLISSIIHKYNTGKLK